MPSRNTLLWAALVGRAMASCSYGTSLNPRAEGEVTVGNFGYDGLTGPTNWLSIDDANINCAVGTRQSPVDMTAGGFPKVAGSAINLQLNDFAEGTEFENLGTTVEVVAEAGGSMTIPGVGDFELQQFHFHLPSEHVDNGTSQAMEMHMVWEGANSSIAVLSAYIGLVDESGASAGQSLAAGVAGASTAAKKFKRSSAADHRADVRRRQDANTTAAAATGPTTLLETVLNTVGNISEPGTATTTPPLVMSELVSLFTAAEFQSYTGSLTTPPCTEGVNWLVSTQKLSILPSTFVKARDVIGFNARFPQGTLGDTNLLQASAQSIGSAAGLGLTGMTKLATVGTTTSSGSTTGSGTRVIVVGGL